MLRSGFLMAVAIAAGATTAQPDVPDEFTARLIAPRLENITPRLSAIDDPRFGTGVLTGIFNNNGLLTVRLVEPAGTIRLIASVQMNDFIGSGPITGVRRIRLDERNLIDGQIQVIVIRETNHVRSRYLTLDEDGRSTVWWTTGDDLNYDFTLAAGPPHDPYAAVLYDGDAGGGSRLSTMDRDFALTTRRSNSVPPGRTDLDVNGMQADVTGLYGGGVLLADCDINTDDWSGVYHLSSPETGGTYMLLGNLLRTSQRCLTDLDITDQGTFGNILYVTEARSNEVKTIDPSGTYETWAGGFNGPSSLSLARDGESMYVADIFGVWLIRRSGNEPGPVVLASEPNAVGGPELTGDPASFFRVIFNEPVTFTDADITITDRLGQPVPFDASGSNSQFMLIGLGEPLFGDTYTVTIADSVTSVATGEPLDGDKDGFAGGDAVLEFTHRCPGDFNGDETINTLDVLQFLNAWNAGCP